MSNVCFLAHLESRKHLGRTQYRVTAIWEDDDACMEARTIWGSSPEQVCESMRNLLVNVQRNDLASAVDAEIGVHAPNKA